MDYLEFLGIIGKRKQLAENYKSTLCYGAKMPHVLNVRSNFSKVMHDTFLSN